MNHALLQHLINLTVLSSAALVVTFLLRPVLRRHGGAALVYGGWCLLPLALMASALPAPAVHVPAFSLPATVLASASTSTPTVADAGLSGATLWLLAWGLGAALTALWMVWQQVRFMRSLGWLQPGRQGSVYLAVDNTQMGPLLLGLLHPRIVLPTDFDSRYDPLEQTLILAHEQVHLHRRDAWANGLTSALQIVFWFNPLLHYAANCFRLDQELACDAAVLQQHPQARQAYANAILKTQLFSGSPPLACHWQSHHPLKERILQLSTSTPHRARRRMATTALASVILATCYGVWATELAPADKASAPVAADAPRYMVDIDFNREVPGNKHRIKQTIAMRDGETRHIFPNRMSDVACTMDLKVQALPKDQALISMLLNCPEFDEPRKPRLQVKLGQEATVGVGYDMGSVKYEYAIGITLNHWPESKAWPEG